MKIVFALLSLIRFVVGTFVKPLIRLSFSIYYRKWDYNKPLPPCKSPLLTMPAHLLAKKIRSKEITSLELVNVYIDRINEIQPLVNCVVKTCFEEALEEARNVDKILSGKTLHEKYSPENAPLLGVPFSCKECFWVEGMPNATGSKLRKDFRAPHDADVVKYMRQSGAILTCLTNTSELCMWFESSNYLYGTTKNPYNLSRIVGGSSGGEGCIVSSAGSIMGIGSDIGGSIRMPAFFNGVYGHKPSRNFISNKFQHPIPTGLQEIMIATGPICRYASDLEILFKVFAGPQFKELAHHFEKKVDFKKLKYYYIDNLQGNILASDLSKDAKNAIHKTVKFIEQRFDVKVNELKYKKFKSAFPIWSTMMSNGKSSTNFAKMLSNTDTPVNPFVELAKSLTGLQSNHTLPAIGLALVERMPVRNVDFYLDMGKKLTAELSETLGDDGVLIFPSFPITAPYHNQPLWTNTFDFIYFGIINALGFPSTQCPLGVSPTDGLPTGVQIIANHRMDHLTIRLAEYFEANSLAGWVQPF